MFQATFSILSLFEKINEKVYGRKKIQKMVHLLEISGVHLPFKYEYHHYGPYSADLQLELNYLVKNGMLEETKEDAAYIYNITDQGKEFLRSLESYNKYNISYNQDLLQSLMGQTSQFLEVVSTYAYLVETGHDLQYAKNKTIELKPHLSKYIDDAIKYFDNMIRN